MRLRYHPVSRLTELAPHPTVPHGCEPSIRTGTSGTPMGRCRAFAVAVCVWGAAGSAGPAIASGDVDLALVIAVDISTSMDPGEQQLQREGYVAAFRHPAVVAAISGGLRGRIAVAYVEWAGRDIQSTVVPWRVIESRDDAEAFASVLADAPLRQAPGTSISSGLLYAGTQFNSVAFQADRRAVDISGDGPNNGGHPVDLIRDWLVRRGITINGLPILLRPEPDMKGGTLEDYYGACVIGGAGAFMVPVTDAGHFAAAIRTKLVLEIAGLGEPALLPAAFASEPWIDCAIAERERTE
jgi:hypothetical protein